MVSQKARDLILSNEGLDQPSKWPEGVSGITIGIGYDLGYEGEAEFRKDWAPFLTQDQINRLATAIGKISFDAKTIAGQFSDIVIKRDDAEKVFNEKSLPKYEQQTRDAFPGFDDLPLDVQGALVSIVYNRGPSMKGDGRIEMRAIRDMVANYKTASEVKLNPGDKCTLQLIADQIISMKRLWFGKNLDGLLRRREEEAQLVESCIGLTGPQGLTGSPGLTGPIGFTGPTPNVSDTSIVTSTGSSSSSSGGIVDMITSIIKIILGKLGG